MTITEELKAQVERLELNKGKIKTLKSNYDSMQNTVRSKDNEISRLNSRISSLERELSSGLELKYAMLSGNNYKVSGYVSFSNSVLVICKTYESRRGKHDDVEFLVKLGGYKSPSKTFYSGFAECTISGSKVTVEIDEDMSGVGITNGEVWVFGV